MPPPLLAAVESRLASGAPPPKPIAQQSSIGDDLISRRERTDATVAAHRPSHPVDRLVRGHAVTDEATNTCRDLEQTAVLNALVHRLLKDGDRPIGGHTAFHEFGEDEYGDG